MLFVLNNRFKFLFARQVSTKYLYFIFLSRRNWPHHTHVGFFACFSNFVVIVDLEVVLALFMMVVQIVSVNIRSICVYISTLCERSTFWNPISKFDMCQMYSRFSSHSNISEWQPLPMIPTFFHQSKKIQSDRH